VISICLFLVVFGGALIWALLLKKSFLKSMSALPLSDEDSVAARKGIHNE